MKAANSILATITLFAFSMAFVSCGGKDTHAKVMGDMVKAMGKIADIISEAKDEDSAKKAAEKLEKMGDSLEEIGKRAEALGDPDEKLEKELEEKFKPQIEEAQGKMMKAMMDLTSKPEAAAIIQKAMESIGDKMGGF